MLEVSYCCQSAKCRGCMNHKTLHHRKVELKLVCLPTEVTAFLLMNMNKNTANIIMNKSLILTSVYYIKSSKRRVIKNSENDMINITLKLLTENLDLHNSFTLSKPQKLLNDESNFVFC